MLLQNDPNRFDEVQSNSSESLVNSGTYADAVRFFTLNQKYF